MESLRTVVLGASPREDRYSNIAVKELLAHGHEVIPAHPACDEIRGIPCVASLDKIAGPVDTLAIYLGEKRSTALLADILRLNPRRIILPPGAENDTLKTQAQEAGILVQEACTMVMLRTGQF